jgi:hypothetical protein
MQPSSRLANESLEPPSSSGAWCGDQQWSAIHGNFVPDMALHPSQRLLRLDCSCLRIQHRCFAFAESGDDSVNIDDERSESMFPASSPTKQPGTSGLLQSRFSLRRTSWLGQQPHACLAPHTKPIWDWRCGARSDQASARIYARLTYLTSHRPHPRPTPLSAGSYSRRLFQCQAMFRHPATLRQTQDLEPRDWHLNLRTYT